MTDSDHDRDDELVSAYLDGEATEAERALVEGDPRRQDRLTELRGVAGLVGQPVAPPASAADAAVARALSAVGPVAPVVSLDDARRRRQRLLLIVTSAAAAVVVLVLALPVLLRDQGSGDQTAIEVTADDADDAGAADGAPTESENAQAGTDGLDNGDDTPLSTVAPAATTVTPPSLAAPAPPDDLGSFATRAEAELAVSVAIDEALAADALRDEDASQYRSLPDATCDTRLQSEDDELLGLVFAGNVVIAGETHQVLVYDLVQTGAQNGTHRIYEVTLPGCAPVSVDTI